MKPSEYAEHDATSLAQLLRDKAVSAQELHATASEAIALVNPHINAMTDGPWDAPLEYAEDGPWAGVPFAIKDLGPHPAGVPMRGGSRITGAGMVGPEDSHLFARYRAQGLATLGLVTTPELGWNASTESVLYGQTHNPWDLSRSAGGSSGGTGAIVAAGGVPVAAGGDGGGSLRIPASANGLVGLRPSRGRTSNAPDYQEVAFGFGIDFALTRTVRDCAALLDAVAGGAPGERFIIPARRVPGPTRSRPSRAVCASRSTPNPGRISRSPPRWRRWSSTWAAPSSHSVTWSNAPRPRSTGTSSSKRRRGCSERGTAGASSAWRSPPATSPARTPSRRP